MVMKDGNTYGPLLRTVLESIFEVFLMCLMGWVLASRGDLDKHTQRKINTINVLLFTPCLLFPGVAFSLDPQKLKALWIIPIIFVVITSVSAAVGWIMGTMLGLKGSQRNFGVAASMFQNTNSLPIALMQSLVVTVQDLKWGSDDNKNAMLGRVLGYLVFYSALSMMVRWSYGVHLLAQGHQEIEPSTTSELGGSVRPGEGLPEAARSPSSGHRQFEQLPTEVPYFVYSHPLNDAASEELLQREDDGCENGHSRQSYQAVTPSTSAEWQRSIRRTKSALIKFLKRIHKFMTAPLYAAIASFIVALIPPLQHLIMDNFTPVRGFLTSAGSCSIPLTMIVLGAYFYEPPGSTEPPTVVFDGEVDENTPLLAEEDADPERGLEVSRSSASNTSTFQISNISLAKYVKSAFNLRRRDKDSERGEMKSDKRPGETATVIVGCVARMIVTPAILLPVVAALVARHAHPLFEDPVFVVSVVLLITSPPALTLAQMTQAASGDEFERLISRTIFWAYCVLTPPLTLIYIVVGLGFLG